MGMRMKTLVNVNLALLPFVIFSILVARGLPEAAIGAGSIASLALCAWRHFSSEIRILETATLSIFGLLAAGLLLFPAVVAAQASALAFTGLGVFAIATVVLQQPWTMEFSRADFPAEAANPIFLAINMIVSGIWGALFLLLALASALKAGAVVAIAIVVVGTVASIFGPKWLIRQALTRRIAALETYHWPAPALGGAHGGEFDVAVVGAGIGGLTAAALLADAGLRVVVAEQHFQPGGFCQSFSRKLHHHGEPVVYRFDAGPHDFSGIWKGGSVTAVLERLGVADRIDWRRIDHSYRFPGLVIDVPRDWHDYVLQLARLFPKAGSGFNGLFATISAIYDGMNSPLISCGGVPGLGMSVESMQAFARQHPLAVEWLGRPFDHLVEQHIADPQARQVITALTGYISDGAEALTCAQMVPLFGYYFQGGHYPLGGSGHFAAVLASAVTERGGALWLNCPVKKIVIESGRAAGLVLADGRRIVAQAVVTNADLRRTFLELIDPAELPGNFRAQIAAAEPALSAFTVHLGVDFVPDIRPVVYATGGPDVGITAMSLLDRQAAPAGHSTLTLISLLPRAKAQGWFAGSPKEENYNARKKQAGDALIAEAEKIIPGLSSHIVYRDEASPQTFCRYDWSSEGSIYGVRQKDRLKGAKSPISGLVMAGSSTHGPGVEAAMISGAAAANALLPGLLAKPRSKHSEALGGAVRTEVALAAAVSDRTPAPYPAAGD